MDAPLLSVGTLIGGYRVESLLGSGGMGSVYRAVHAKLGRKAAIKVLASPLAADPEYVSRFFHEARIVAEVGHPNIIDIIDFIDTESPRRVAYVMELVEGPPLSRVLKKQRLSARQAINIALQLLDALTAVHRIEVVHRDLKPDNILVLGGLDTDLSGKASIKVLDFGIAKMQREGASHKTSTGMMLGTPAYMAPEQAAGETVSPATDVYAVGELLYEMLTNRRLFDGKGMEILKAKVGDQPPQINLPPDLPHRARFEQAIRDCIAVDQRQRPSTAALSATLRSLLGDESDLVLSSPMIATPVPYQATLSSMHTALTAPPPRSKMWIVALAVLGLLVSTILTVVLLDAPQPIAVHMIAEPPPPPPPIIAPPPPEPSPPPIVAAPPPVKKNVAHRQKPPPKKDPKGPLKKGEFPTW